MPTFREALAFWFKLGLISFGGPAGQIGIMHEFLVEKKRWISERRFLHALNYCMLLPGPEAQQLATYTGWLMHGRKGGLAAGMLFVLPSMLVLLGLSMVYVLYGQLPAVNALFDGLKPAVIAVVILALYKIGRKALLSLLHVAFAGLAFVSLYVFQWPFPLVMISLIVAAVLIRFVWPALLKKTASNTEPAAPEQPVHPSAKGDQVRYSIGDEDALPHMHFQRKSLLLIAAAALAAWFLPRVLFMVFSPDYAFWNTLTMFFTKAALVTFGGAYAVLPYVAQVSVEQLGWLGNEQMVDGLALGESTPGPLVMVLTFVGFMGGFNHFGGSLMMGALALLITTWYTFLPCFLFVFAGAPLIERTRNNTRLRGALALVSAGVVGVMLNLSLYLAREVLFAGSFSLQSADYFALAWLLISILAMYRFGWGMMSWLGISAAFGLLRYTLASSGML